ncbi:MAG: IS5 family transposase [Gemmataceae bacterium]|nr:IS5 family transposase [Gemmataceae bacterium]
MRGRADDHLPLFHVFSVDDRIRPDHPLRDVKRRVDRLLAGMSPAFAKAYSATGRPSVPPERLLKALLLMALYSVRSERQLCERIDTDLLFRWFLDLQPSDDAFDATTFTHNRARLDTHGLTKAFFAAVVGEAVAAGLCSDHFTVDGTLIESWAALKSFRPVDQAEPGPGDGNAFQPRNPDVDFRGQARTNDTHRSRTDPEAKLYRKGPGKEAKLSHMGHALGENRHGLILAVAATAATGTAEREAALAMLDAVHAEQGLRPSTLGTDKGYDDGQFLLDLEGRRVEPHVPLVKGPQDPAGVRHLQRRPGIEARQRMKARQETEGYGLSQRCRKKIEEGFGWLKSVAGLGRSRVVGRWKLRQLLEVGAAAYNLVRLRSLKPA